MSVRVPRIAYHETARFFIRLSPTGRNITAFIGGKTNRRERSCFCRLGIPGRRADWVADADGDSNVDNENLSSGCHFDSKTGMFHVRNRCYHSTFRQMADSRPINGTSLAAATAME